MKECGIELVGGKQKLMNHKEFFGCRYPIVAASMNQVSDIKLAIACYEAGIFPSLPIYSYSKNNLHIDYDLLDRDLKLFEDKTGSNKIMLTAGVADCLYDDLFNLIMSHQIKHIELIASDYSYKREAKESLVKEYKSSGVKLIPKVLLCSQIKLGNIDAVILKGKDGAGRGLVEIDQELFKVQEAYPELPVIASGGISTNADIKNYLDLGCMSVSIGTMLAASEESPISVATKEKIIKSTYQDVSRFENQSQQNALVFSKVEDDDLNHTQSLIQGIKDPSRGHVFVGKGIDQIHSILPVKDIIQSLVEGL